MDVEKALAIAGECKSSGDELDSKEETCSRNGMDDAAEQYSDSTRSELTESDADAGTVLEPKDAELDAVPVPKPRKRKVSSIVEIPKPRRLKDDSSAVVPTENKQDAVKVEEVVKSKKQEKVAPQRHSVMTRHRKKGTS